MKAYKVSCRGTEKRDQSYRAHLEKESVTGIAVDVRTLLNWEASKPEHGDTWGNWRYNAKQRVLTHVPKGYAIGLVECSTSGQTLDWVFQLADKPWMTDKDIADFIRAVKDIIDPQANLCSFGTDKTLDVNRHLTAKA